jgi:hypothetical protein
MPAAAAGVQAPYTSATQQKCCLDAKASGKTSCKQGCIGGHCKDGSTQWGCALVAEAPMPARKA